MLWALENDENERVKEIREFFARLYSRGWLIRIKKIRWWFVSRTGFLGSFRLVCLLPNKPAMTTFFPSKTSAPSHSVKPQMRSSLLHLASSASFHTNMSIHKHTTYNLLSLSCQRRQSARDTLRFSGVWSLWCRPRRHSLKSTRPFGMWKRMHCSCKLRSSCICKPPYSTIESKTYLKLVKA